MIWLGFFVGAVLGSILGALYLLHVVGALVAVPLNALILLISQLPPLSWIGLGQVLQWAAALNLGAGLLAFLLLVVVHALLTLLFYWIADASVGATAASVGAIGGGAGELFGSGALMGMNALANFVLLLPLLLVPDPIVPLLPWFILLLGFLATFTALSRNPIYQGFLSWFSWLMPLSWLATGVGLAILIINRLAFLLGFPVITLVPGLAPVALNPAFGAPPYRFDWRTGTVVTHGGYLTILPGGYNLGNFMHVNLVHTDFPNSFFLMTVSSIIWHETGHTLNVAAFGPMFHYLGAIHQNLILGPAGTPQLAYSEVTAESHRRISAPVGGANFNTWVPVWGLPANTPPTALITPVVNLGTPPTVPVGTAATFAASMVDPESTVGFFLWFLSVVPAGSALPVNTSGPVAPATALVASFTPDVAGDYNVALIANDTIENGATATFTITAT